MGNQSSSRRVRLGVRPRHHFLSREDHSQGIVDKTSALATDDLNISSDDSYVKGHLISFNATLMKDHNHEYTLPEGEHFYFDPYKPDECIIVCLVCSFERISHDHSNLEKKHVKTVLEKLLNDKGITDVGVCVLVIEDHTKPKPTSATKDISLRIGLPKNVSERVTEHDIKTAITDHLSPAGYMIGSVELIGTLVSSGLVTLKPSDIDSIKLIPKGTKFTFFDYNASTELDPHTISLMTAFRDYPLCYHAHDSTFPEWDHYTSEKAITFLSEQHILQIVIQITYFFNEMNTKFSAEAIAKYLKEQMKSSDFDVFSVITTHAGDAMSYSSTDSSPEIRVQPSLWIGVNLWLFVKGLEVPNVQQHLETYFKQINHKYQVLPQVPARGIIWPPHLLPFEFRN